MAVEALEVFIFCPLRRAEALLLLRDQVVRLGQLCQAWAARAWGSVTVHFVDWGLRLLRYRSSSALAPLLWGEAR